jgi:hypothetical protein
LWTVRSSAFRVGFYSARNRACRPNPSTALAKISITIPHRVDFFNKNTDCAIKERDKKTFPIMESLTPACRSACLPDISCSTNAAASGTKNASFHPSEAGRELVVLSMSGFISHSGALCQVEALSYAASTGVSTSTIGSTVTSLRSERATRQARSVFSISRSARSRSESCAIVSTGRMTTRVN